VKRKAFVFASILVLVAVAVFFAVSTKPVASEADKVLLKFDAVARELGYEFSALEMIRSPITYSDKDGNTVIFNSFYCSDPERIENEEAIFYSKVFDPKSADSIQEVEINGAKAILCTMDSRSFLIWHPDENTILMLDYEPGTVKDADILRMAESCE